MPQLEDFFRTGKLEAETEPETRMAAELFEGVPIELPAEYDIDVDDASQIVSNGNPMFANNRLGCCVISGRAHQTLRFELLETGNIIKLTDADVERQYFRETGNRDNGLVLLRSLKSWRDEGWTIGGRRYQISDYASINVTNRQEIKKAILMNYGIGIGLLLPDNAVRTFQEGRHWTETRRPKSGGHYVYVTGYSPQGLACVTWGAKQHMSWPFFEKYCDEAYAIIDRQA
jgi:hypothetical protein